jgi:hypothetical protein
VISVLAFVFSLGTGAGYAASPLTGHDAPAAGVTFHNLPLINGWKGVGESPRYAVSAGVVYLSGGMHQTIAHGPLIFAVLPAGARPAHTISIGLYTSNGAQPSTGAEGVLVIGTNGDMSAFQGFAPTLSSLAGLSFPRSS